jgi:steroid delta-isomerase-like uncharacterized protein
MAECWSQGRLESARELVAEECRYHDQAFPTLTSGEKNIERHIDSCRKSFPDLTFTIEDTIAERNEVVLHWVARGTHKATFLGMPPTDRKAEVAGTTIFRIDDRKITEIWSDWNLMTMLQQLGMDKIPEQVEVKIPRKNT